MNLEPQINATVSNIVTAIKSAWTKLAFIINGNISFGDGINKNNLDIWFSSGVTVATPGTFVVTHGLGRVPVGFFVAKMDLADIVTFVSATKTNITLSAVNGGSNVLLVIF